MSEHLYTTSEAAGLLDVTPARVRQMVARGEIESVKMGRDRFITAEAIEEARRRKTKPGPTPKAAEQPVVTKAGGKKKGGKK
jgi:excisionase family DNA binding protein